MIDDREGVGFGGRAAAIIFASYVKDPRHGLAWDHRGYMHTGVVGPDRCPRCDCQSASASASASAIVVVVVAHCVNDDTSYSLTIMNNIYLADTSAIDSM